MNRAAPATISPTSPTVAFKVGERMADPLAMYLSDLCTIPVNLAALPGISVPAGFSAGLPVGLQIMGPHFSERGMFGVAHAVQQRLGANVVAPVAPSPPRVAPVVAR